MARFIAIAWNERSDQTRVHADALVKRVEEARSGWRRSLDLPGLIVFGPAATTRADEGCDFLGGRLIGAAFAASGGHRPGADALPADEIKASRGAALFDKLWGRYVAVWKDEPDACAYIARDPSGAQGCFMAKRGRAHVFFSHGKDIDAIALAETGVDWGYLAQRLVNNRVISHRTGLAAVEELAPGAVARVGQGQGSVEEIWRAERFAAAAAAWPREDARVALKTCVVDVVRAWADLFDRAALRLSGGLDSAIVAAALAGAACDFQAVNYVTPTPEGDERAFARAAARRAGLALTEIKRDPSTVRLVEAVAIGPNVRPPLWLADGETEAADSEFARCHRLEAFFSGRGGDNVFFRTEGAHAVVDQWHAERLSPRLLQAVWAHAKACGRPIFEVAREVVSARKGGMRPNRTGDLLSEKARALAPPAAEEDHDLPLGKRLHIAMIEDRLNYFDPRPNVDYIYPLVSQPVLETVLALPTYVLAPGGIDRGLARAAFAGEVAPEVLARRSKGQTTGYLLQILIGNLPFLRPYLLDGVLASEGMLATDALSRLLSEGGLITAPRRLSELMGVLNVEAWLRAMAKAR